MLTPHRCRHAGNQAQDEDADRYQSMRDREDDAADDLLARGFATQGVTDDDRLAQALALSRLSNPAPRPETPPGWTSEDWALALQLEAEDRSPDDRYDAVNEALIRQMMDEDGRA